MLNKATGNNLALCLVWSYSILCVSDDYSHIHSLSTLLETPVRRLIQDGEAGLIVRGMISGYDLA